MTGIEQLRKMGADAVRGGEVGRTICDIADQIEREHADDRFRMGERSLDAIRAEAEQALCVELGAPIDEGADPLDVLRRYVGCLTDTIENLRLELGEARDRSADVSMSAYDLLPQEDRDAIAWVRDHGGLDAVKRRWECLSYYADPVPRSYAERRIASRQRQIDESHAAIRRRNARIAELESERDELRTRVENQRASLDGLTAAIDEMRPRLMPEGMEWMLWDDGRPVTYDDAPDDVVGVYLALDGSGYALMTDLPAQLMSEPSERVKRPAKVLDADGVEIREGDEVWTDYGDGPWTVTSITTDHAWHVHGESDELGSLDMPPSTLTHRAPVLAADGRPLREGETVWAIDDGIRYEVRKAEASEDGRILVRPDYSPYDEHIDPSLLTHERPDSWERLEEDAESLRQTIAAQLGDYDFDESGKDSVQTRLMGLVRRAKALAERDA